MHKPEIIIDEIGGDDGSVQKWILDLTQISLMGILTDWSKSDESIEVVCDNAPVFRDSFILNYFNNMGMSGEKAKFLDAKLGFKLKKPIISSDSRSELGIQIADIFSSTTYYCLKERDSDFSKKILNFVSENCICRPHTFSVMPDLDFVLRGEKKKIIMSLMNDTYYQITGKI